MSSFSHYIKAYIDHNKLTGAELPEDSAQPAFAEYYPVPAYPIPNNANISIPEITEHQYFSDFDFSNLPDTCILKYQLNDGPWLYFRYDVNAPDTLNYGARYANPDVIEDYYEDLDKNVEMTIAPASSKLYVLLNKNTDNVIRFLLYDDPTFRFPKPETALVLPIEHDEDWNSGIHIYPLNPIAAVVNYDDTAYIQFSGLQGEDNKILYTITGPDGRMEEHMVEGLDNNSLVPVDLLGVGENTINVVCFDKEYGRFPNLKYGEKVIIEYDPTMENPDVVNEVLNTNLNYDKNVIPFNAAIFVGARDLIMGSHVYQALPHDYVFDAANTTIEPDLEEVMRLLGYDPDDDESWNYVVASEYGYDWYLYCATRKLFTYRLNNNLYCEPFILNVGTNVINLPLAYGKNKVRYKVFDENTHLMPQATIEHVMNIYRKWNS